MVKLKFKRRPVKQNIFNLNRGKTLKFVSSGHTSPAFGSFLNIPKPNFNRSLLNRPALSFYGDSDGDGVINGFDCAPNNSRLQGKMHKMTPEQREYNKRMQEAEKRAIQKERDAEEDMEARGLNKKDFFE